ncbi:DUF917 domain-containing protein [Streptosporangium sp. NPDC051023]|uniref:DUF917 domain-containing protein n=1 Tax=Streptosporangium sp. NPDC051023 TaxID=3155410 RepID=UPI00344B4E65
MTVRQITADRMADIARGAAILGAGGGGDPYIGRLLAEQAILRHGPVTLVDIDDVADDAVVVPVAMMGAPTVMVEKPPSGEEIHTALRALQEVLGREITHLACIEAGGVNSTIPIVAAAETGLPLLDADGMGRAFPELQMVLPTLAGVSTCPLVLADEKGNTSLLRTADNRYAERFARSIAVEMGCSAMTAQYILRGSQLRDALVPGTLTLVERLGRTVREARGRRDPVAAAVGVLGGRLLFTGKVVDVVRRTSGGFAYGTARLTGTGAYGDSALELEFQNENLVARLDGRVVAGVPDLICVLETDGGEPVTTEGLRYGFRVSVVGAPCDPRWRTAEGLALAGPGYFGYDHDYVPVELSATRGGS